LERLSHQKSSFKPPFCSSGEGFYRLAVFTNAPTPLSSFAVQGHFLWNTVGLGFDAQSSRSYAAHGRGKADADPAALASGYGVTTCFARNNEISAHIDGGDVHIGTASVGNGNYLRRAGALRGLIAEIHLSREQIERRGNSRKEDLLHPRNVRVMNQESSISFPRGGRLEPQCDRATLMLNQLRATGVLLIEIPTRLDTLDFDCSVTEQL